MRWEAGAVRLVVVGPEGPVPDTPVRFQGPSSLEPARVRGDGYLDLTLSVGEWTAVVEAPGHATQERTFVVQPDDDQRQRVDVGLLAGGHPHRRPLPAPGRPGGLLAGVRVTDGAVLGPALRAASWWPRACPWATSSSWSRADHRGPAGRGVGGGRGGHVTDAAAHHPAGARVAGGGVGRPAPRCLRAAHRSQGHPACAAGRRRRAVACPSPGHLGDCPHPRSPPPRDPRRRGEYGRPSPHRGGWEAVPSDQQAILGLERCPWWCAR